MLFHKLSENPASKAQEVLKNGKPQYSKITQKLKSLIKNFQYAQDEEIRINAFFVLDFIQHNYGSEMMGVKTGEKFKESMMLMFAKRGKWKRARDPENWMRKIVAEFPGSKK
ncbi:hypothetical protein VP01_6702g1, partial [Puccinia sorghi]